MQKTEVPEGQVIDQLLFVMKIISSGAILIALVLAAILKSSDRFNLDLNYYSHITQDPVATALLVFAVIAWFSRNYVAGWIFQKAQANNKSERARIPYQKYFASHALKIWTMEASLFATFIMAYITHEAAAFVMIACLQILNVLIEFPSEERVRHRIQMLTGRKQN